jgi:hypothetical protein
MDFLARYVLEMTVVSWGMDWPFVENESAITVQATKFPWDVPDGLRWEAGQLPALKLREPRVR